MSVVGMQDYWVAGARFYFVRDDDTNGALIDLGTVQSAAPTIEASKLELKDGDGGVRRTVDEVVTEINESYEVTCNNFNPTNLALAFMSNEPAEFTQAATPLTDVSHTAVIGLGKYVKLKDASGNFLYNITSIVVKNSGGTVTYTEGKAYDWISKDRGIIEILEAGDISDGDTILITITPAAISGKRLIKPQTSGGAIKGTGLLIFGRNNNAQQTVREAAMSITPSNTNIQSEDFSDFAITAKVLGDITDTVTPAGRMLQFKGDLPSMSTDGSAE